MSKRTDTNNHFALFACCLPVKGAVRATICDVQRQHFDLIPLMLYELLTTDAGTPYPTIIEKYGAENQHYIDEYFDFLETNEYGFWCDAATYALFPPIDLHWEIPFALNTCIIDVDAHSDYSIAAIITQLDALACPALQVRVYAQKPFTFYTDLLAMLEGTRIRALELMLPYSDAYEHTVLHTFAIRHERIAQIIVHGAPFQEVADVVPQLTKVIYTKEVITGAHHCGVVSPGYFMVNLNLFAESQAFNSCLNKKIAVDAHGEIKNCPSMTDSYGHVHTTSLSEALATPGFRDKWGIHKDQVETCRDCEFRYICTDCRAYLQEPQNKYSKPLKCTYDPYSGEWEEVASYEPQATSYKSQATSL
jgi:SPASM domain peptide maturase of grasp-with-spasm system